MMFHSLGLAVSFSYSNLKLHHGGTESFWGLEPPSRQAPDRLKRGA